MAAVPLSYRATLYDLRNKRSMEVYLEGDAFVTGLGIGGGPMPPGPGNGGGQPPVIWPGPGIPPEGQAPIPSHPIALPGDPWWPGTAPKPPELPPPGSPPVVIPGTTPTNPIVPPPAIVVDYPGIGKVLVPQPAT